MDNLKVSFPHGKVNYLLKPSILCIGLPDDNEGQASEFEQTEIPYSKWYLFNIKNKEGFAINSEPVEAEEFPDLPVAKSKFWSAKVSNVVFVIGGNDDMHSWFWIDFR